MTKYLHLHDLVFNQPHLCTPDYAETVISVLSDKFNMGEPKQDLQSYQELEAKRKENTTQDGVYVLPISGSMTHKAGFLDAMSGIQSYQSIKSDIKAALEDTNVKSILLDMDSPGGTVAGAFDLRDYVMEAKEEKPIYAIAQDQMASAAYLIGSACTKVYATQTAQVGSIGVVAMHIDQSSKNEKDGIKPTYIYQGDMKVAGNPHEKLEGDALDYIQDSVNESYEMFVQAVSDARGLDPQVIRDTQARVYRGQKAKEIGLVDEVMSFDALNQELASDSQQRVTFQMSKGENMDKEDEKLEADNVQISAEDYTKIKTDNESLRKALIENGFKITAEGVEAPEPKQEAETIEFEGNTIDLSEMGSDAAEAFKKMVADKKDAELSAKASEMFPHMETEAAKEFASMELSEAALSALKAADASLKDAMEESGRSDVNGEFESANDKMDAMTKAYMEEHSMKKSDYAKAYSAVANTDEGREVLKAIRKGE